MKETTVVIALITSLAAIIAPLITKTIECNHETKLKNMEILLSKKIQVYEIFIQTASNYVYSSGKDGPEYAEYLKSYNSALLISDFITHDSLIKFSNCMNKLRSLDGINKSLYIESEWFNSFNDVCTKMNLNINFFKGD